MSLRLGVSRKSDHEVASSIDEAQLYRTGTVWPVLWAVKGELKGTVEVLSLVVLDLLALTVAFTSGWVMRHILLPIISPVFERQTASGVIPFSGYLPVGQMAWLIGIVFFFLAYQGLYQRRYSAWQEFEQTSKAVLLAMLMAFAFVFASKGGDQISRPFLVLFWLNLIWLLPLIRYWGKRLLMRLGLWQREILILGAGDTGRLLIQSFLRDPTFGYQPVGFLDDDPGKQNTVIKYRDLSVPVLGRLDQVEDIINSHRITDVAVAIPGMEGRQLVELVNQLQLRVRNVMVVPDLFGLPLSGLEMGFLYDEQAVLLNVHNKLADRFNVLLKRAFDVTLSLIALPLALPLMALIAIAIKLDSPGPIFYTQKRVGRGGQSFLVFKFRSMIVGADQVLKDYLAQNPELLEEWQRDFKLKNDPRITRVGRFLRQLSLDELPQLINVLKGEMSLVGPRPIVEQEVEKYGQFIRYYYAVNPGITGLWQVSGRNDIDYNTRINFDVWYVRNWSIWLDLLLILRTVGVVLSRRGAY